VDEYDTDLGPLRWPVDQISTVNLSVQIFSTAEWDYTVEIPAHELFSHPRQYGRTGNYEITDNSIVISSVVVVLRLPRLSGVMFTIGVHLS
jgi:hypothetical protein